MDILLVLTVGALCIACFFIGAKVGQQVSKGVPLEAPVPNLLKTAQERQEKKAVEKEREKMDVILQNIDTYDGTGAGQKDVPA